MMRLLEHPRRLRAAKFHAREIPCMKALRSETFLCLICFSACDGQKPRFDTAIAVVRYDAMSDSPSFSPHTGHKDKED